MSNVCTKEIKKGQYVIVDGSELVVNGTFDSDISGWVERTGFSTTLAYNSGKIDVTANVISGASEQTITTVPGVNYRVKALCDTVGGFIQVYANSGALNKSSNTSIGNGSYLYLTFTAISTSTTLWLKPSTISTIFTFDNISVRRVSDTFRAKQDAPVGTALTDTTYFEDRTQIGVTNQVLSYHAYNTLTNSYEGIKTEVLFSDVSKEDLLDNSVWMARNGFSKVSEYLYSKGSYLVLPVGIWQSLNKGAYHPVFNGFGTRGTFYSDGTVYSSDWYIVPRDIYVNSTADTFKIGSVGSSDTFARLESGNMSYPTRQKHPQGKYYDICYPDQFIDVREYAKIANKYEIELLRDDKIENGVEEVVSTEYILNKRPTSTDETRLEVGLPLEDAEKLFKYGDTVWHNGKAYKVDYVSYHYSGDTYLHIQSEYLPVNCVLNEPIMYTKTKPILSSGTKLSIDLIGNPDNYPDVVKQRLASDVGINGVYPLLVSDEGVDLVPTDNSTKTFKLSGKVNKPDAVYARFSNGVVETGGAYITTAYGIDNSESHNNIYSNNRNILISYTSNNEPYQQTDPKPVLEVEPKAIASNSHSIYKDAMITAQVSGKIPTGNGTNGYESKVLENSEIPQYIELPLNTAVTLIPYTNYKFLTGYTNIEANTIWTWTGSAIATTTNPAWTTINNWTRIYELYTPTHSTLALDNSNSPASKYFNVLETDDNHNLYAGVYGKELIYDSGFGDNDEFDQLTNGTDTDLNGNTIRTFHGSNALNIKVK